MPYSPQQPGEDAATWQSRLERDYLALKDSMPDASPERLSHAWTTPPPPPKHASQMPPGEYAAALGAIKEAARAPQPLPQVFGGRRAADLTPIEYHAALGAYGGRQRYWPR